MRVLVLSALLLVTVAGQKCRFSSKDLPGKMEKYQQDCLDKGFSESTLDNCEGAAGKKLKSKQVSKCKNLDTYLKKCNMACEPMGDEGTEADHHQEEEEEEINCPAGSFRGNDENGEMSCELCPFDSWSNDQYNPCVPCPDGTYSGRGNPFEDLCTAPECGPGFFYEVERHSDTDIGFACSTCPPGTWSDGTTEDECNPCPEGHLSQRGSSSEDDCRAPCGSGEFYRMHGQSEEDRYVQCYTCPPNTWSDGQTEDECNRCPEGSYSEQGSSSEDDCQEPRCRDGEFYRINQDSNGHDFVECYDCPSNTWSADGQTEDECNRCPEGSYSEQGSSSEDDCVSPDCPAGSYYEMVETFLGIEFGCFMCPPNTWSERNTENECNPCPEGTYSGNGTTSEDECERPDCDAGSFYSVEDGIILCEVCPPNTWSDGSSEDECNMCPDGTYSGEGSTSEDACLEPFMNCDAGSYIAGGNRVTSVECLMCPENMWSDGTEESCNECPDGTISEAGSSSQDDCHDDVSEDRQLSSKIHAVSQSSTRSQGRDRMSAEFAIDGDIETASQTKCAWNTEHRFTVEFRGRQCVDKVKFMQSFMDYNAYRMQHTEVVVMDEDEEHNCGRITINDDKTVEGQTYEVMCDGACGDSVMLKVRHDKGKYSYMGCLHISEIEVHFEESDMDEDMGDMLTCDRGQFVDLKTNSCRDCPAGFSSNHGADSMDACYKDCVDLDRNERDEYRGRVSHTESGRRCQNWASQYPNVHKQTPENKPDAGLEDNYCRNPDGSDYPWCYNGEGTEPRWEYCEVPHCEQESKCPAGYGWQEDRSGKMVCQMCPENTWANSNSTCVSCPRGYISDEGSYDEEHCRFDCMTYQDRDGSDYRGRIAHTVSGKMCQRWDSQSPNAHKQTSEFKEGSGLDENYCRNPDRSEGAWCYNGEGNNPRWEYCDIPRCHEEESWRNEMMDEEDVRYEEDDMMDKDEDRDEDQDRDEDEDRDEHRDEDEDDFDYDDDDRDAFEENEDEDDYEDFDDDDEDQDDFDEDDDDDYEDDEDDMDMEDATTSMEEATMELITATMEDMEEEGGSDDVMIMVEEEGCGRGSGKLRDGGDCELCPENHFSPANSDACFSCDEGQVAERGAAFLEHCYYMHFHEKEDQEYELEKMGGQAEGMLLTGTSEKRNGKSGFVHLHEEEENNSWKIKKTSFKDRDCWVIEFQGDRNEGRVLVVHGSETDDGDGRLLVHKTPYNRPEDECWELEGSLQFNKQAWKIRKSRGRHSGKYLVAINEKGDGHWWADVTDRDEAMTEPYWSIYEAGSAFEN